MLSINPTKYYLNFELELTKLYVRSPNNTYSYFILICFITFEYPNYI